MDCVPKSVAEFLQTKSYSNGVVLLQQEDETSSQASLESQSNGSGHDKVIMQNAVRVALLLVHSFMDLCSASNIRHDQEKHHLLTLELDDFFVQLEKDRSNIYLYGGQQDDLGPEVKSSDIYECFHQIMDEEEERKRDTVKDANGRALGLGYFSLNNDGGPARHTQKSKNGSQNGLSSEPIDEGSQRTVLYGIDIIFPTRMNDLGQQNPQSSVTTPMQVLGKLLYRVFCRGEQPPSDMFMRAPTPVSDDACINEISLERFLKNVCTTQESVFSTLLSESSSLPVSICRFLSDLLESGVDCQSETPFKSFDDVVEELEQMISRPQVFLHNSSLSQGGASTPLVFGHIYYGRDEEVGKIIRVAAHMEQTCTEYNVGVEAVYVSGTAGSGKSQLVQTASDYLSNLGWILVKAKFERGAEHLSRGILLGMFSEIISLLVRIKDQGDTSADAMKAQKASESILESIGLDGISQLVEFIPSFQNLFDNIDSDSGRSIEDWQLSYFLSSILEAVVGSGLKVMVCCDDLQWADRTSLALITEVLTKLGENLRRSRRCCLFLGLYREDEVYDDHPFSIQYSYLQMSSNINATEIRLGTLSKKSVADMLMTELRLPIRLVGELADIVHKRTSGHAFFIVELLNSLVRDGIISYSPKQCQYTWSRDAIDLIQTGESVAELIASNISSMPEKSQRVLRILSCFGIQTDLPLLQVLEVFEEGMTSQIDEFIDQGILDRAGPIIIFSHDLIQQSVYESMALDERQQLHIDMGEFLGNLAHAPNVPSSIDPVTIGMNQLQLRDQTFFAGVSLAASLITIACDQLNAAGPDAIYDDMQKLDIAEWNSCAGQKSSQHSDFRAALFYFSQGIEFLGSGSDCWLNDHQLCLSLHEGAVFASFSLGESDHAVRFAREVIQHVSFEDTLEVQFILLKSLGQSGKHSECISHGIKVLNKLKFDLPLSPSKEVVMNAMASTDKVASQYSIDGILNLCEKVIETSAQNIIRIMDAFYLSCYASGSPFLSLISCELVKYSLKHGVCQESLVAFASYAMFKIFFFDDIAAGQELAQIIRAITKKTQTSNKSNMKAHDIRAHLLLYITVDIWELSPRQLSRKLLSYHDSAKKLNQVDTAMIALQMGWRYLLYGGEKLSIIFQSLEDRVDEIAKNSEYATKYLALDNALLSVLTGQSVDHLADIDGMVCDIDAITSEAEAVCNNRLLHHIHVNNAMIAYWRQDFDAAEKSAHKGWEYPTARMPTIVLIVHTFFGGLIAFRLLQQSGDDDQGSRLKEGKELMERMGKWAEISSSVFSNKWLLLKAEFLASREKYDEAEAQYHSSLSAARDRGNIHELALAYELLGDFYLARGHTTNADSSYMKAHMFYMQWGASAIAEKLRHKHNLDLNRVESDQQNGISKRTRDDL